MSRLYGYTMNLLSKYENPQLKRNVLTVEDILPLLRFTSELAGHLEMLLDEAKGLDKRVNVLEEKLQEDPMKNWEGAE